MTEEPAGETWKEENGSDLVVMAGLFEEKVIR